VNSRVSLRIGSGPPGTVSVRNPDGTLVASASIGASPSFIEPWTFARGQTIQTERAGSESGNVTVTLFDVPPDVTAAMTIDAPEVTIRTEQPGQNAVMTFSGASAQRVVVQVAGITMSAVTVRVLSPDQTVLASITSSAARFALPAVTLHSTSTHTIIVDPIAASIGTMRVSVTTSPER
jgi:hypothetical protein